MYVFLEKSEKTPSVLQRIRLFKLARSPVALPRAADLARFLLPQHKLSDGRLPLSPAFKFEVDDISVHFRRNYFYPDAFFVRRTI